GFSVTFNPRQYTEYYLQCRDVAIRGGMTVPSEILTEDQLNTIEQKTSQKEEKIKKLEIVFQSENILIKKKERQAIIN
ncbi:MAG: hypothetical protein EZS28_039870, partial [Streblomastix strix]